MKFGILIGLVVVINHVSGWSVGCGCSGSSGSFHHGTYGSYQEERQSGCRGCGFNFPVRKCTGEQLTQESDWCNGRSGDRNCVPLIVRPHEIPKPIVNPEVEIDLSQVVANPCAIKKAIVKPAVLPKPVCRPQAQGCHSSHQGCCGSGHCTNPCYGQGPVVPYGIYQGGIGPGGALRTGASGSFGISGASGLFGISGGPGAPGSAGGPFGANGQFAPADAVSMALAYKLAKEAELRSTQSEDRLQFGFRKLPLELPPKKVVQANVPEEGIFNLNGQIVELKPVMPTSGNSPAALAEEAAEQLLNLEEEEAENLVNGGADGMSGPSAGIRRVSLSEIGYGLAKAPKPNLVEVPRSEATVQSNNIATNCGCGHYNHGCGGYACGQTGGCASCCQKCDCKIIPGNVEYQTKPKPPQICLPPAVLPDSCESGEIEIEHEDHGFKCSCVPVCVKHCNQSCKKSCITIEKLLQ